MKYANGARLKGWAAWLALMLCGLSPAEASQSDVTPPVVGHKPTASGVTLSPSAPLAGEAVTASWAYADDDNDIESGSGIEWLLDDVVAGQGVSFIPPGDSAGKNLQVRVTPRSAAPADPVQGESVNSAKVVIGQNPSAVACTPEETLSNEGLTFTCPPPRGMTWFVANDYCQSQGARLPTVRELQSLHANKTSGGNNSQMCTKYGWPLGGQCGGGAQYWTGESRSSGSEFYWIVYMNDGTASEFGHYPGGRQVTCVR
ncbi:hypothetical protein ACET60_05715 [Aeromonas veronii]